MSDTIHTLKSEGIKILRPTKTTVLQIDTSELNENQLQELMDLFDKWVKENIKENG